MDRRTFLATSLAGAAASTGFLAPTRAAGQQAEGSFGPDRFKLKYAPHFGMFRHHAGKDPVDQVKFMADQGFTALEDNGMMGKPPALQERIAAAMAERGMTMGVFVSYADFRSDGFVKRDPRVKERKKYGQRGARARFQFSKR